MQIKQEPLLDFLGQPGTRFSIPVFQRVYSWNARQCEDLWDDMMRAGAEGTEHFMGLVLYSRDAEGWSGAEQLDVIDGQQRMTTVSLLIVALCSHLQETDGKVAGLNNRVLQERYLLVRHGSNTACRLQLSDMDRDTLAALVGAGDAPEEPAQRLIDNMNLFLEKMQQPGFDAEQLWRGMCALRIADVLLEAEDSPQLVFESLNSKGMPLSTADRVRNYLIASSTGAEQTRLFDGCWVPLEEQAANAPEPADVTSILHAWLSESYRNVRIFDASEVYGVFKACLRGEYDGSLERLLADVAAYAQRYLADAELREEADERAREWVAGKPENSVSEFKMFGD